jgi:hypothetical protein
MRFDMARPQGKVLAIQERGDIVHLLRATVERERGQTAFAKRHGVDRVLVNTILNGKRPVSDAILGLRVRRQIIGSGSRPDQSEEDHLA